MRGGLAAFLRTSDDMGLGGHGDALVARVVDSPAEPDPGKVQQREGPRKAICASNVAQGQFDEGRRESTTVGGTALRTICSFTLLIRSFG